MPHFNPDPATIKEICEYHGWTAKQLRSALEKNYIAEIIQDCITYEKEK